MVDKPDQERVWERIDVLAEQTVENAQRLAVHEAQCVGRYGAIMERLKWLTYALAALAVAQLLGGRAMFAVIFRALGWP